MRRFYLHPDPVAKKAFTMLGPLSFLVLGLVTAIHYFGTNRTDETVLKAERLMAQSIATIHQYRLSHDLPIDPTTDPNRTGLIGPEYSSLTTTLGDLPAKRSTTNPRMAGLLVHLLREAGVQRGDTIAVGSSGSFPGLLVAVLCAAEALHVHPVVIVSLGASSFGATDPNFNLLHIYQVLLENGLVSVPPAAVSLGGEKDVGGEYPTELRQSLLDQIRNSGVSLIYEPDLERNVRKRMEIYLGRGHSRRIAAFVNCGGAFANMGTSPLILKLNPGINRTFNLPPKKQDGVLFAMARRDIPVIHLLYIRGLISKYQLHWDPVPFPSLQVVSLRGTSKEELWLGGSYFVFCLILIVVMKKGASPKNKTR